MYHVDYVAINVKDFKNIMILVTEEYTLFKLYKTRYTVNNESRNSSSRQSSGDSCSNARSSGYSKLSRIFSSGNISSELLGEVEVVVVVVLGVVVEIVLVVVVEEVIV